MLVPVAVTVEMTVEMPVEVTVAVAVEIEVATEVIVVGDVVVLVTVEVTADAGVYEKVELAWKDPYVAFTVYVPLTQRLFTPGWNVSLYAPFDPTVTLSANTMTPAGLVTLNETIYP